MLEFLENLWDRILAAWEFKDFRYLLWWRYGFAWICVDDAVRFGKFDVCTIMDTGEKLLITRVYNSNIMPPNGGFKVTRYSLDT